VPLTKEPRSFVRATLCPDLLGECPSFRRFLDLVDRSAGARGGLLILAEAGIDTEAIAREIHLRSPRASAPFVRVTCALADPAALERELFGDRAGKAGDLETVSEGSRVAAARGGTLFLQDVGELPAPAQARLARLARDGEMKVSGVGEVPFDVRLMASSTPDLDAEAEEGRFRADLHRRLGSTRIEPPPLRQRADDIPLLAAHLTRELCAARGLPPKTFTPAALTLLAALPWHGNSGELRTVLERVIVAASDEVVQLEDLLAHIKLDGAPKLLSPNGSLREARLRFEREYIAAVLQHHRWRMSDAAKALGIQRPNLYRKARQLGIPIKSLLTALLLVATLASALSAQPRQTTAGPQQGASPQQPASGQPQTSQQPTPGPEQDYIVGAQDLLTISVFEEPQLSGRFRVDNDGTFTFPFIGRVQAGGQTLRAIEDRLTKALAAGYLKNPQVNVEVDQYKSQSVFVIGEVRLPGKYPLAGNMSLIEALAQAGSMTSTASNEVLIVHPKERRTTGPIMPDDTSGADVVRVNIRDLQSGKLAHNVEIKDGDTIFVPKAETFFITGQVRNPGSYVMERGVTVLQAISLAGGLTERGSNRRIKIVRIVNGKKLELTVKLSDAVLPGDTIVVPQRFF
jgi:polysaccharide export protein EpsE